MRIFGKRCTLYPLVLLLPLMSSLTGAMGQDLKSALEKMRSTYQKMEALHISMSVEVYETPKAEAALYTLDVDIKKQGDNYLYHYGDNQMLMNDRYFILVDGMAKEMVCRPRNGEGISDQGFFQFSIDSIMSFYGQPEYLGKQKGVEMYRIQQKTGPVDRLELWIDERTALLRRMDYWYRQGAYVKIMFNLFDGSPSFRAGTFDEQRFVLRKEGKMTTSDDYSQYHLVFTPQG